jgi:hypothetical protein
MPVSRPTTTSHASRRLALVDANELRHREHLAFERLLQFGHADAGRQPDLLGHGVEPEPVAVGAVPAGWAGSAVADRAEVVVSFTRRRLALGQPTRVRAMPQASQWTNRPPGASGSSKISASERLPVGGAVHDSGGERSSPSQV